MVLKYNAYVKSAMFTIKILFLYQCLLVYLFFPWQISYLKYKISLYQNSGVQWCPMSQNQLWLTLKMDSTKPTKEQNMISSSYLYDRFDGLWPTLNLFKIKKIQKIETKLHIKTKATDKALIWLQKLPFTNTHTNF